MVGPLLQPGRGGGDELHPAGCELVCEPSWERLHARGQRQEMAVAGASRLRGSCGSFAPLLLSSPETAVANFHGEEFRAGCRHAQSGRVGRPDAGREWLHELLEGFAPQPSNRKLFERFVGEASVPHRHEPFAEQPQPPER